MDDMRAPGVLDAPDALVSLAQAGDEAAFARIVRLHRTAMVQVSLVVTLDMDRAVEAVAAAWPVAWSRIDDLGDAARLRPWLCSIAAREAREVMLYGSSRLDLGPSPRAAGPVPPPGAPATSGDPELTRLLAAVRPEDRVMLALRYVGELSPAELGHAAAATSRAVVAHTNRLARSLGARLGPGGAGAATTDARFIRRLRAYADVPVGHVNIDAVARVAKMTRHDRRNRLASLVLAAIAALLVMAVPYLGESGPWPAWVASMTSPSPPPSMDVAPGDQAPH